MVATQQVLPRSKENTVRIFVKNSKINVYDTKQVKYINLMTNITYFIFHIIFTSTAKK